MMVESEDVDARVLRERFYNSYLSWVSTESVISFSQVERLVRPTPRLCDMSTSGDSWKKRSNKDK